jgi:hypothetical protein
MSDHPLVPKHNPCPMKRREKENIVLSNNKISKRYDDFVIAHNVLNHFSFVATKTQQSEPEKSNNISLRNYLAQNKIC